VNQLVKRVAMAMIDRGQQQAFVKRELGAKVAGAALDFCADAVQQRFAPRQHARQIRMRPLVLEMDVPIGLGLIEFVAQGRALARNALGGERIAVAELTYGFGKLAFGGIE
jgi:hypothetical protein